MIRPLLRNEKGCEMNVSVLAIRICLIWMSLFCLLVTGCRTVHCEDAGLAYDLVSPSEVKSMREKIDALETLSNGLAHDFAEEKDSRALSRLSSVRKDIDEIQRLLGKVNAVLENSSQELDNRLTAEHQKAEIETLARMRDFRFAYVRFEPPQNLYDAIRFLTDRVKADPAGKGLDFQFHLQLSDDQEAYVSSDGSVQMFSKNPILYPVLPFLSAADISYYDVLSLLCSSIDCDMYVGTKSISISKRDGARPSDYSGDEN